MSNNYSSNTTKSSKTSTASKDSKASKASKASNVPKVPNVLNGTKIILYSIDENRYEEFIVRPGKKLIFEYELGTPFKYKINNENKFSDYCDLIELINEEGEQHDSYIKHVVLSGGMCLAPITKNSRYSNRYSNQDYEYDYSRKYYDDE